MKLSDVIWTLVVIGLFGCSVKGDKGDQGIPGLVGTPGPAGSTVVRLCPKNANDSYPSVFNEYAFCMDGSLYGTYSANDGFTTKILPGLWTSKAIGSSCNFIVGANCQVAQQ